ncbi:MAG: YdcF family protein [Lachnospiraceae bacterium]
MLTWICAIGAVLCLLYFLVIVFYSGIGTSFAVVWLLLGLLLGATASGFRYYQKYPGKLVLWVPVSLVTLCASGVLILLVVQILMFGQIPVTAEPGLDYVIVLGAGIRKDGMSNTLKLRLDKAAEYALENPETILVLSGGQGDGEPETEAAAMQTYLLDLGVPRRQLLLEDRSTNTTENIAYSRILVDQRYNKSRPVRVGLLTSNFHLYRAGMIARKQGFATVYGIAAESDRVLFVHYCIRDCAAILKDRLVGNI